MIQCSVFKACFTLMLLLWTELFLTAKITMVLQLCQYCLMSLTKACPGEGTCTPHYTLNFTLQSCFLVIFNLPSYNRHRIRKLFLEAAVCEGVSSQPYKNFCVFKTNCLNSVYFTDVLAAILYFPWLFIFVLEWQPCLRCKLDAKETKHNFWIPD